MASVLCLVCYLSIFSFINGTCQYKSYVFYFFFFNKRQFVHTFKNVLMVGNTTGF